jgi:hypothetical protein
MLQREIPERVNLLVAKEARAAGVPVYMDAGGNATLFLHCCYTVATLLLHCCYTERQGMPVCLSTWMWRTIPITIIIIITITITIASFPPPHPPPSFLSL